MGRKTENTSFTCLHCGMDVPPIEKGSLRNHCPNCLYSLHVDREPGDRASDCGGLMEPAGCRRHSQKGWQILHRCVKCGFTRYNMVNSSGVCPDNMNILYRLMKEGI